MKGKNTNKMNLVLAHNNGHLPPPLEVRLDTRLGFASQWFLSAKLFVSLSIGRNWIFHVGIVKSRGKYCLLGQQFVPMEFNSGYEMELCERFQFGKVFDSSVVQKSAVSSLDVTLILFG